MDKDKSITSYTDGYRNVIRSISSLLKEAKITFALLEEGTYLSPYVINLTNGVTIRITGVATLPRDGDIQLFLKDGTDLCISDYESNDNSVIADPVTLLNAVSQAIESLYGPCRPKGNTAKDYIDAIADYIGKGGCVPFEHGFRGPQILDGTLIEVRDDGAVIRITVDGTKFLNRVPFGELNLGGLKTIVNALNDYLRYCRESA